MDEEYDSGEPAEGGSMGWRRGRPSPRTARVSGRHAPFGTDTGSRRAGVGDLLHPSTYARRNGQRGARWVGPRDRQLAVSSATTARRRRASDHLVESLGAC